MEGSAVNAICQVQSVSRLTSAGLSSHADTEALRIDSEFFRGLLVPKDAGVRMIVLPIEPIILERKDPREALPLHIARNGATVEAPPAEGRVVNERPGSLAFAALWP